jgi:hypothetical protein
MSLILDHVNGVPDDNRLHNLRVVCPNCAATLDTHCGRKNRRRACEACGKTFLPNFAGQRYCSQPCGRRDGTGTPIETSRKVERPPYEQLLEEIRATSYLAVGRKYGVSDNAVRKWVRFYERQAEWEQANGRGDSAVDADG